MNGMSGSGAEMLDTTGFQLYILPNISKGDLIMNRPGFGVPSANTVKNVRTVVVFVCLKSREE